MMIKSDNKILQKNIKINLNLEIFDYKKEDENWYRPFKFLYPNENYENPNYNCCITLKLNKYLGQILIYFKFIPRITTSLISYTKHILQKIRNCNYNL